MPETWAELAAQVSSLGGQVTGKESTEELKRAIAKTHYDPEKHLLQLCPMLAYDATMDFSDSGAYFWSEYEGAYYAEPKIDEVRALLFFKDGKCRIQSRGRHKYTQLFHEMTANFPWVQEFYRPELEGTILDGGLVAGIKPGRKRNIWVGNDLLLMMSMVGSGPERSAAIQREKGRPVFIVWDVLKHKEVSVLSPWRGFRQVTIEERRRWAKSILQSISHPDMLLIPQWSSQLAHHYHSVVKTGGEGVMLKRKESFYFYKRSKDWLKVKRYEDVVGYVHSKKADGNNAWRGLVGSINVADKHGLILGAVGTMTLERRKELSMADGSLNPDFIGRPLVMRFYKKHADTGNPRHARLIGWLEEDNHEETVKEEGL